MTKRPDKHIKRDQKVIPFPGLKDRLVEKGLAKLQSQLHKEAIELLVEAYALDGEDPVTGTSLAVALYEDRQWEQSKTICERLLFEGLGDYEEMLELYILNLLQLKEHDQIITTIETVIDEQIISADKQAHFEHLLAMSKRHEQQDEGQPTQSFSLGEKLEQQMIQVANLAKQNVHPFKQSLIDSIQDKNTHPFIKTMVLNVLREQGVQDTVTIEKWTHREVVNPAQLVDPFESEKFREVAEVIQKEGGQVDPTLSELAIDLIRRHIFLLYPFSWDEIDVKVIGEAYLQLAKSYMGEAIEWSEKEKNGIVKEIEILENVSMI
ncbi:hypothetical protein [Jeotgalibacillus marinus]|uniref:Tetratricopeptide repeat protein n=1 Tax=Jeotgalibacillus marinus TaxID=86667 RepID=A0ABV3Q027_9BACL